jgi:phospholipase/lecithinase/hemolysin
MKTARSIILSLALAATLGSSQASASIMQVVVFGDSLSDGGNLYNITGGFPPPPYAQRFSDGPVAVEYMAERLGMALAPSTIGGTNYAVAGAATGAVASNLGAYSGTYDSYVAYAASLPALNGLTGMDKQVAAYLSGAPSGLADTLFVLWGGANDLFLDPTAPTMSQAVFNLSSEISALIGVGATRFLIPAMPDWSQTPEGQAGTAAERAYMSSLNMQFNSDLAAALAILESTNPGVDIVGFDTNALLQDIIANAGAYGFSVTATSCVDDGCFMTPGLADEYMFWDHVHPSTRLSQILGNAFASAVPEPGSTLLLGIGLLSMVWLRRSAARRNTALAA